MSRAHMLYGDPALASLPVKVIDWSSSVFVEKDTFKTTSGFGLIVQGIIKGKSKVTVVEGNGTKKHRFFVLLIEADKVYHRRFAADGNEIEPDFASTKKINTGFLMSSYRSVSKDGEGVINPNKIREHLSADDRLTQVTRNQFSELNETNSKMATFWCYEADYENIDLPVSACVRLRTKGSGCLTESITWLEQDKQTQSSYTSESPVGGSWTEKIMDVKSDGTTQSSIDPIKRTIDNEGADDDEWVSIDISKDV